MRARLSPSASAVTWVLAGRLSWPMHRRLHGPRGVLAGQRWAHRRLDRVPRGQLSGDLEHVGRGALAIAPGGAPAATGTAGNVFRTSISDPRTATSTWRAACFCDVAC